MNKELFVLIVALCCYNLVNAPITMISGWAKFVDDYPLGFYGCFITVGFASIINCVTGLTLALISYERRKVISFRFHGQRRRSGTGKILLLLFLIIMLPTFVYGYLFHFHAGLFAMTWKPILEPGAKNVHICYLVIGKSQLPIEIILPMLQFVAPTVIICYNYGKLWLLGKRLKLKTTSMSFGHRRNLFFSRLMILSLVEFVASQFPIQIVLAIVWMENMTGKRHLQSTAAFVACVPIYLDSMINPLWLSFIKLKRQTQTGMALKSLVTNNYSRSEMSEKELRLPESTG